MAQHNALRGQVHLPTDKTCLHVLEVGCEAGVPLAAKRAGIDDGRVVPVEQIERSKSQRGGLPAKEETMNCTTHTSRWLVMALVALLGMAVGPTAAWAEDRPAPAFGIAALSEATGRPAPAYGVSQGAGATPASVPSIGDAPHEGLLSRPAPAYRPAAETPTVRSGFDWPTAAIGIAIGFGLAALVGLAILAGRRRDTLQRT